MGLGTGSSLGGSPTADRPLTPRTAPAALAAGSLRAAADVGRAAAARRSALPRTGCRGADRRRGAADPTQVPAPPDSSGARSAPGSAGVHQPLHLRGGTLLVLAFAALGLDGLARLLRGVVVVGRLVCHGLAPSSTAGRGSVYIWVLGRARASAASAQLETEPRPEDRDLRSRPPIAHRCCRRGSGVVHRPPGPDGTGMRSGSCHAAQVGPPRRPARR